VVSLRADGENGGRVQKWARIAIEGRSTLRGDAGPVGFGSGGVCPIHRFLLVVDTLFVGRPGTVAAVGPAGIATGLFCVGLGVFAAFYFSSTVVDDSKTYGTIGVTFTLVTWFIAIGAVLTLGAVVGAVWQRRRATKARAGHGES
jgi:hypothetical protein